MISNPNEVFTGYVPRQQQYDIHKSKARFKVIVTHRRFGNSVFCINTLIDAVLKCKNPMPRFAYVGPSYGQVKRTVWDMFKHYTQNIPGVEYHEGDLRIDFHTNKGKILLLSAENPNSLRGLYLDGVVLDEMADIAPSVYKEVVRPTLVDRKGWAIFCGTPKGDNYFKELYDYGKTSGDKDWFTAIFKASETRIVPQEELEQLRKQMSEDEYNQEFECDFSSGMVGNYFAKELKKAEEEGRITRVPCDPVIPVDTYWDLGMDDVTAVWFMQKTRFEKRFIDYMEVGGSSIPEILVQVKKKNYNLDEFVLPHDAKVRDLSTGKARMQMFYEHGCRRIRVVPRVGSKQESINAARVMLATSWFDKDKCALGLKALANYQKKWDEKRQTFGTNPLHNWASNGADAFQCAALGMREGVDGGGEVSSRFLSGDEELLAETEYDVYA